MKNVSKPEVGDIIHAKIEAKEEKGDGLFKIDGFVIFVPDTDIGEQVKVRITKIFSKIGFAEVI